MNRILVIRLFFTLLLFAPCLSRGGESLPLSTGVYPIPGVEMRKQVAKWLGGAGFRFSGGWPDGDPFSLECTRNGERYLVEILQYSPLASYAEVSGSADRKRLESIVSGLKASLADYVNDIPLERTVLSPRVPGPVQSMGKAVFCLNASMNGESIGFTGFAVDRRGLIVSTAHDLVGVDKITVSMKDGEEVQGRVIKRDPERDLILVKVGRDFPVSVPVGKGRLKLRMGEKLYSLVCPGRNHGDVLMGIVDEPPAMVSKQPLWQVHMEVSPGESGGAVFDTKGRLAGIVKGRLRGGWSRGFLIPVNTLREFLGTEGR